MEELQSTDILDREILEDARKKALRILKTADDTVRTQTAEWERKTAASLDELAKKHSEQCRLAAEEIMARLPIDKHRAKAEKIENLLRSAVGSWYAGLSRARILELLSGELAKRLAFSEEVAASEQKRTIICGIDRKEAESILKSAAGTCAGNFVAQCTIEEIPAHGYPSITLETGNVRVTASIQKTVDFLLHEKRAELAGALLGPFVEEV